jgi:hypothetical protein
VTADLGNFLDTINDVTTIYNATAYSLSFLQPQKKEIKGSKLKEMAWPHD